jgi:hypothetical protein
VLTRGLGMSAEEVELMLTEARNSINSGKTARLCSDVSFRVFLGGKGNNASQIYRIREET